jgi:outer membrane immunogenic protein
MRKPLFAMVASLLLATPSFAADLPRRSAPPVETYAPPPTYSWQGFYAGINAGYAFASFEDGGQALGRPNGGQIGFTGGYNHMLAPNLMIGLETDFAFAGLKSSRLPFFGYASSGRIDDIFTVRGRVGYAVDRALIFATGGYAGSNNTATVTNFFTAFYGQQSVFQSGWALGGGLEYMLTNNLSAKAEYLFTDVGSDRFFDFSPNALQTSVTTSTVKGGLNYHF